MTCRHIQFLDVWTFSPLNYYQNTLGYCFSERWCCQKIRPFYHKRQSCFIGPIIAYTYNLDSSVFNEFDDKDI